jgi:hypothetical protein
MNRLTLATLLPAASSVCADVEYTITRVIMPPEVIPPGAPRAINNNGEAVGTVFDADEPDSPLLWSHKGWVYRPGEGVTILILPDTTAGTFNYPTDINDAGVIIGSTQETFGWRETGYVLKDGQYTMLGGFDSPRPWPSPGALDINEKGQIVAQAGDGQTGDILTVILSPVDQGCPPDLDGNGVLDLFDFLAFVNLFNANDPSADCDASGFLDLFDFLCYTNAFNEGC